MIQIERVEAVQFDAIMIAGRTSPLLLTCEKADGSTIEAIVKFATGGECTQDSLCAELIASQLAADLKLPTPTPVIVTWEEAFADSIVEPQARRLVTSSSPPAFGSTLVTNGFATWPTERKLVGEEIRQAALAIFFFDAMIGNSDRGGMKPNILVRGDTIRLIDHELAFQDYRLIVQSTPPWGLGGLNGLVIPGAHIFAVQLTKNAKELDFCPIKAAWAALSDSQVEAYEASVPPEWITDRRLTAFAVARIKQCRDRIDDCVAECRRALDVGT
jgi:hypothetical protein